MEVSTLDYLQALYGKCDSGDIVFVGHTRNYVTGSFPVADIEGAAAHVASRPLDLFIKVNPLNRAATLARSSCGVGGSDEVDQIVSLHLDVDAGEKNGEKYISQAGLLDALSKMPLTPSLIIFSDGEDLGLHAYWLLAEPYLIQNPEFRGKDAKHLPLELQKDNPDRDRCAGIALRWLEELRLKVQEIDAKATVDGTANLDRLLRPIGSSRKSGNIVKAMKWNPERRYQLSDFELPALPQQQTDWSGPAGQSRETGEGENIIEQYLDVVGKNTVEAILFEKGYDRCNGSDRFLIRAGSSSGAPTGEIFTVDGKRGFTVKSGAAAPLTCTNSKGKTGNWYSVPKLWVTFEHGGDWKKAAKFCYDFLRPADVPGIENLTANATARPTDKKVLIKSRRMDSVVAERIDWWWAGRIPRANLAVFGGQGGCGKSSACNDLIGRHTTGRPFPGETEWREPQNAGIINCEDDAATIIRPRLDAAGADCSRVHLLDSLVIGEDELWIDFSNHSKAIEEAITQLEITLLVIDPISGHMGGKKQNDTAEVREVLQRIQAMAKRTGCTIIAITHSPKTAANAQSAIIGSQAFVSCARAAFAFVVDKDDPKRRIMLSAKNNYSADETGLAYRIEDHDGIGKVEWDDTPVTEHADSFFTPTGSETGKRAVVDDVASRLRDFIVEPLKANDVHAWARAEMISPATLRRAKEKLGIDVQKRPDAWYWLPVAGATRGTQIFTRTP